MNRRFLLVLAPPVLLAAAGLLWMKTRPPAEGPEAAASCGGTEHRCEIAEVAPEAPPPASSAPPAPDAPSAAEAPLVVLDPVGLMEEADRQIAEGRVAEGIENLRQATYANPTAKNHGDLGDLLLRLTAIDEALVHLRAAAELDAGNPNRWIDLANAYYRKVDPGEAWKAERRARELLPEGAMQRGPGGLWRKTGDSATPNP
jgi:tetratricopeptide (TPR) repeat protein